MKREKVILPTVLETTLHDFDKKQNLDQATGCMLWTGTTTTGKNGKPYGFVQWRCGGETRRRRKLYAHRVAYCIAQGIDYPELRGYDVHHTCGNTLCVNPAHLKAVPSDVHGRGHRLGQLSADERGWRQYLDSIEAEAVPA